MAGCLWRSGKRGAGAAADAVDGGAAADRDAVALVAAEVWADEDADDAAVGTDAAAVRSAVHSAMVRVRMNSPGPVRLAAIQSRVVGRQVCSMVSIN